MNTRQLRKFKQKSPSLASVVRGRLHPQPPQGVTSSSSTHHRNGCLGGNGLHRCVLTFRAMEEYGWQRYQCTPRFSRIPRANTPIMQRDDAKEHSSMLSKGEVIATDTTDTFSPVIHPGRKKEPTRSFSLLPVPTAQSRTASSARSLANNLFPFFLRRGAQFFQPTP